MAWVWQCRESIESEYALKPTNKIFKQGISDTCDQLRMIPIQFKCTTLISIAWKASLNFINFGHLLKKKKSV